jgi:DNA polymerase-3 subunit delta
MPDALHALDYLDKPHKYPPAPVCVVYGDEPLLKREALIALRKSVLGEEEGDFSLTVLAGRDAQPRDVFDELATVALFGSGRRMVLIEEADDFVSRYRAELEKYVAQPSKSGVLALDVKSWASNTRLYKTLDADGLQIQCKTPTPAKLHKWLVKRAKNTHRVALEPAAAERLTDLIDAAAAGDAAEALLQLDRLLTAGENPIALLGQIASTLRRFAAATRLVRQAELAGRRPALRPILEQAGFKKFVLEKAEKQLRQIGRDRGGQLYRWLLDADLALKGASSAPGRARLVLEQLIVRLSAAANPRQAARRG